MNNIYLREPENTNELNEVDWQMKGAIEERVERNLKRCHDVNTSWEISRMRAEMQGLILALINQEPMVSWFEYFCGMVGDGIIAGREAMDGGKGKETGMWLKLSGSLLMKERKDRV